MNEANTLTTNTSVVTEQDKGRCAPAPGSAFRVRQPLPFGRHELWPSEYPTLGDAIRDVDRVGNTAVEIINAAGEVVLHSKLWWKKHGKDGRP
jgi:hypothetical protein